MGYLEAIGKGLKKRIDNKSTSVSIEYKNQEASVAAFHLMVVTMCTEYMKQMSSIQFTDSSEKKAVLEKLGLTNSKTYKDIIASEDIRKEAELLNHFKVNFPNSMFMKLEDFKDLCRKYGLVCGPLDEFKGEIPDKNLKEIEAALENYSNMENLSQFFDFDLYTFERIIVLERGGTNYKNQIESIKDDLSHFHFRKHSHGDIINFYEPNEIQHIARLGGDNPGIYADMKFQCPQRMLIAASSDLMSQIQVSYMEIPAPDPKIKDDPIVFQILQHDIVMIHSKWGDEANDPMLEERKL